MVQKSGIERPCLKVLENSLFESLSDAAKMKNNGKPKCNLLISAMQPTVVFTDSPGFVIACQKTFPWARSMINVDKTREAETKYDSGSKKSNFDSDSNSDVLKQSKLLK